MLNIAQIGIVITQEKTMSFNVFRFRALIPLAIASGAAYAAERLFLGSSEKGLAKGADQYVRQGINAVKTARNVTGMVKGVLDQAALAV